MKLLLIIFFVLISSCSNIQMITTPERKLAVKVDTTKLYRQSFLQKMSDIKATFKKGKHDQSLKDLSMIDDKTLSVSEKGTKKNLVGVIYFTKKEFDQAIKYFEEALIYSKEDPSLEAQVSLNLGSAYFKTNQNEKALTILSQTEFRNLPDGEAKKYHHLYSILSEQMGKKEQSLTALMRTFEDKKSLAEVKSDEKYLKVEDMFSKLSATEKVRLLEEFDDDKNLLIPLLAYKEAEGARRNGDNDKMQDFYTWIEKRFKDNSEVMDLINGLGIRNANSNVKVDSKVIGVALPLSGERKSLGERALQGIEIAMDELNLISSTNFKLEVKDTQSSAATGAFAVKDLVEVNNVAAIIGGLNPSSATKEYLEAKKHGILFISLSPVLLSKEEKNHLLIEIPGSIESQLDYLFSDKMISKLGNRPVIIYPKTELGEAYANEFWRRAKKQNFEVNGLMSFDKNASDFRDPVKNILGIKFTKEREEEASLVNEIANLEKNKSIKRLQNLQPQIDFDWVFVPALPKEAVQVLPNFNYFDAFNLNYVGVPSWRSELMTNEGYRYGNVYFVDENLSTNETQFTKKFNEKFNREPKFVETISYDAIKVISSIITSDSSISTRSDMDKELIKKGSIQGESGVWKFDDGIWLKQMSVFKIKREGVEGI